MILNDVWSAERDGFDIWFTEMSGFAFLIWRVERGGAGINPRTWTDCLSLTGGNRFDVLDTFGVFLDTLTQSGDF